YGITGGLLYVLSHALGKAGLFFATGAVEEAEMTGELDKLGGWAKNSPALAGACGVLVLSIMGLPPTIGFFAKMGVIIGAVQKDIRYGIGALIAALFTIFYLSRLYARVFLGSRSMINQTPTGGTKKTVSRMAVALVVIMAVITILAGVLWFIPVRFLNVGHSFRSGGGW
ncbi:MAG: proton-conducting transporter transmembrane domain-containing protein, partial [bacterium]